MSQRPSLFGFDVTDHLPHVAARLMVQRYIALFFKLRSVLLAFSPAVGWPPSYLLGLRVFCSTLAFQGKVFETMLLMIRGVFIYINIVPPPVSAAWILLAHMCALAHQLSPSSLSRSPFTVVMFGGYPQPWSSSFRCIPHYEVWGESSMYYTF